MKSFIQGMDDLPKWIKLLLALPVIDTIWIIYRLGKSITYNHTLGVIYSVFLLIPGLFFMWLVDTISIAVKNKVYWINF